MRTEVKVADEVWVITALLHREHPEREDFSIGEIVSRAAEEHIAGELRPGVQTHASNHCVASKKPNPGRYRILTETIRGRRRLFREGDYFHPKRKGSKITPHAAELPAKYLSLLDWYKQNYSMGSSSPPIRGATPEDLAPFYNTLGREESVQMMKIIEEGCEQINEQDW